MANLSYESILEEIQYELEMKSYAGEPTTEKLERLLDKNNKFSRRLLDFLIKFYVEKTTINETGSKKTKKRVQHRIVYHSRKLKDDEEECETCGGTGVITTMERVYPNEPHMAPIGEEPCPDCSDKGIDSDCE